MKPRFRKLFVLAVSCLVWVARPAETFAQPSEVASSDFVRLVRLPSPTITDSATPYRGGGAEATNILDGVLRSEYASHAKGTNTFIHFDFGKPTLIAGLRHVDRNDPATIVFSELIFMDESDRIIAKTPVAHVHKRAGVTFVALPSPVTAQRVRWQVTELGPERHDCVGGAEIAFYTAAEPEKVPLGIKIEAVAFPVLERMASGLVQPVRVTLDYSYGREVEGVIRVEGLPPRSLRLALGSPSFDAVIPAVQSEKQLGISVEVAGQTVARSELRLRPVRPMTIYILPHSHVDIGYTELQADVEKKQMRNIARGIELARATANYPEGARFKWNVEVLWAVDSYLRQSQPAKQQEFIEAVRHGWVGLDAMYGNELTGLCRPEELLRLFRYATELGQRCGVPVDSAMISDVPGYTWGTVSAMAHAGVKYFSFAPNYFDRIGTSLEEWENKVFYWVSASGEEKVLCWMPYYGYALSHVIRELTEPFMLSQSLRYQDVGYPYEIAHLRWSGLGDNATPDEQVPEFVRKWNEKYAQPKLAIATTAEAFRALEQKHGRQVPEVRGEYTPYWEDGAGTSARETAVNRASAERLVQAETLWAVRNPGPLPAREFQEAWRNVLLYSEHTWGAHNSVSEPDLHFVREQWRVKQAFALDADKQSRALLAQALGAAGRHASGAPAPGTAAVDVFNTCSWARTDLVTLEPELSAAGDRVVDEHDKPVPSQRLSSGELAFLARGVPPLTAKRFRVEAGPAWAQSAVKAEARTLVHPDFRLRVDEQTGAIASWIVRPLGRELVDDKAATALNDYFYLLGADAKDAKRNGLPRISIKERGPLVASLLIESEAPGCHRLVREVRVVDGLDRVELLNLVDKQAVRVKEGVHFGFGFNVPDGTMRMDTGWTVVRPELDQIPAACKNSFSVQRWVDIANDAFGVTWASVDAPLVEVGGLTGIIGAIPGSQRDPRSWIQHLQPSQTIYSWVMNNHWHTNYRAEQEGPTVFRYFLRAHRGYSPLEAARFGVACSQPLIATRASSPALDTPRLKLSSDRVLVTAFKPSDDGKAWIVRLFGASGKTEKVKLSWAEPKPGKFWLSDTSERRLETAPESVRVPGWGIVTLRAEL